MLKTAGASIHGFRILCSVFCRYRNASSVSSAPSISASGKSFEFWNLLHRVSAILQKPYVSESCLKQLPQLTPEHVSQVLLLPSNPNSALRFFDWIGTQRGYTHTVACYLPLINLLISQNLLVKASSLRISMIRQCGRQQQQIPELLEAIFLLNSKGFKMTFEAYLALLRVLAMWGFAEFSVRVYKEMLRDGIQPDFKIHNIMINAFCKQGLVKEANTFLCKIIRGCWYLDVYTFTYLIGALCRTGELQEASRIFHHMNRKSR